jgi:hypothetical protein
MIQKFLLTVLIAAASATAAMAEPIRPADDALVLLATTSGAPVVKPQNKDAAIAFARDAIARGRSAGDPRLYGEAEAALQPWWLEPEPADDILILRATIRQASHDFGTALADLDRLIARKPADMQAHLSRAFIHMVQGNHAAARDDCVSIADPRARLVRAICEARIAALTGPAAKAATDLEAMLRQSQVNPALQDFAIAVLAEITAAAGDETKAATLLQSLIAGGNTDVATLSALADLLLRQNKLKETLALLEGKGESDALLLRRVIAARQLNDTRLAKWQAILDDRFAAAAASNNRVHLREEARYRLEVLGDAQTALALSLENWTTQKEPADMELVLASALAAMKPETAGPVIDFITSSEISDARLMPALARFPPRLTP